MSDPSLFKTQPSLVSNHSTQLPKIQHPSHLSQTENSQLAIDFSVCVHLFSIPHPHPHPQPQRDAVNGRIAHQRLEATLQLLQRCLLAVARQQVPWT